MHVSSKQQRASAWLAAIGALLAAFMVGALSLSAPSGQTRYVSDINFGTSAGWRVVDLARYSGKAAVFTTAVGEELTVTTDASRDLTAVTIRVWSHAAKDTTGATRVSLRVADTRVEAEYGPPSVGLTPVTFSLPPGTRGQQLVFRTEAVGQPAVVIDHAELRYAGGIDVARAIARGALLAALVGTFILVGRFCILPVASSGQTFASIDMMRGLGALLVAALHASGYAGLPDLSDVDVLDKFTKNGHFGVEIFYVLSAYTLIFGLGSFATKGANAGAIGDFWLRRIVRILPAFVAVLVLAFLLRPWLDGTWDAANALNVFQNFIFMTYIFDRNVLMAPLGHSVLWSISTEFQFYALMPLLFLPLLAVTFGFGRASRWLLPTLGTATMLIGVALSMHARTALADQPWLPYTVVYHLDAFMVGAGLGIFMLNRPSRDGSGDKPRTPVAPWIASIGVAGILIALSAVVTFAQPLAQQLAALDKVSALRIVVITATAAAILAARALEFGGSRIAGLDWLRTAGILSFLIYLVHVPVMQVVSEWTPALPLNATDDLYLFVFTLSVALSAIVSIALHRLIEHPALALSRIPLARKFLLPLALLFMVGFAFAFTMALIGL